MKRIISLFICLALVLCCAACFTACGKDEETAQTQNSSEANETPQPQNGSETNDTPKAEADMFTFVYKGNQIRIDDDMAAVLELLGEPKSYFEAESCAFKGLDKTYTYSGFKITTRPDGDKDYVNCIEFTDSTVATVNNLYIGSTAEDVIKACGESEADSETLLSYSKDNVFLEFIIADGKVTSVSYLSGQQQ